MVEILTEWLCCFIFFCCKLIIGSRCWVNPIEVDLVRFEIHFVDFSVLNFSIRLFVSIRLLHKQVTRNEKKRLDEWVSREPNLIFPPVDAVCTGKDSNGIVRKKPMSCQIRINYVWKMQMYPCHQLNQSISHHTEAASSMQNKCTQAH